jgi:hypothetical protein
LAVLLLATGCTAAPSPNRPDLGHERTIDVQRSDRPRDRDRHRAPSPRYPRGIEWDQAIEHVGTRQRVCGPLAGIGTDSDDVFLNIGRDFPDPGRFTIVLWDVGGVEPVPPGTLLCATGVVTDFEGVAQIQLRSVHAVEVY